MARRYISLRRPTGYISDDYDDAHPVTISVVETIGTPEDTGLLDETGTPLYRVDVRNPIGFRGPRR